MSDNFALPDGNFEVLKQYYTFGSEIHPLEEIQSNTPTFNYNYLSLDKSNLCFNNVALDKREFTEYFKIVKEISSIPISELLGKEKEKYHCHTIEGSKLDRIEYKIKRLLSVDDKIKLTELPMVGQFAIYTDPPKTESNKIISKAPRVVFIFGNFGVLHILLLDYDHEIYKQLPAKINKVDKTAQAFMGKIKGMSKIYKKNKGK